MKPVIAITAGDPCGIGPEVVLKVLTSRSFRRQVRVVIIGDLSVFQMTARRLRRSLPRWDVVSSQLQATGGRARHLSPLTFIDCGHHGLFRVGRSSREAGYASLAYLDQAIALWRAKHIDALVTAPVTKWAIARSWPTFVGQTEYLARALHRREVAMMFLADQLRVVLLTRHVALRDVADAVTPQVLKATLRLAAKALSRQFGIAHPHLACCGLNPHAGEGGLFGDEERRLLRPVLSALRREGVRCDGPFAADGLFAHLVSARRVRYDAVVCWYHDQGLIPFKMVARDRGCQLTIGLPLIRTSPDHGSALDIAGQGIADPGSMRYALKLAIKLATH